LKSLKKNTIFNYLGQLFNMLVGVIMTPFYISNLGAESYGLIAFFSLLSTWMNLLDMGMTPTLSREVSASRGRKNGSLNFLKLLRSFEFIFLIISIIVFILFYFFRDWISNEWIHSEILNKTEISKCILIMGSLLGLRWFSTIYRSILVGIECQVELNIINLFFSTLKFIAVLLVLQFINKSILSFFLYQFIIGLFEVIFLIHFVYRKLPKSKSRIPLISFYWSSIKAVFPYTASLAYSSAIWIMVSQVDKLILSGILSLKNYGYFNLVIVIASIITTLSSPISQAVLPRLVYLNSINDKTGMINLYKSSTQLVTLVSSTLMIIIALYPENIIYLWTGNLEAANWSKNILFWYALGNGILSISSFQHYLQVAIGNLKLQVFGDTLSIFIDVPIIIFFSLKFGALGTAIVWFVLRLLWFLIWIPLVHRKYIPNFHIKWLINDIVKIFLSVITTAILLHFFFPIVSTNRPKIFFYLSLTGIVVLFSGSISSSFIRFKLLLNA
jgi:O-antigen/teichoic acid export membrane protein